MDHKIEAPLGKHAQSIHRSGDEIQIETPLAGHLPVEFQHRRRKIDNRHPGPGRRIERSMLSPAGSEAEHLQSREPFGQPAPPHRSTTPQPGAGIVKGLIHSRLGERPLGLRQPVPGAGVVLQHRKAIGAGERLDLWGQRVHSYSRS